MLIDRTAKPREYAVALYCEHCSYWLRTRVQNPKGEHRCTECGKAMEVFFKDGVPVGASANGRGEGK